jgi:hypothetical protein
MADEEHPEQCLHVDEVLARYPLVHVITIRKGAGIGGARLEFAERRCEHSSVDRGR